MTSVGMCHPVQFLAMARAELFQLMCWRLCLCCDNRDLVRDAYSVDAQHGCHFAVVGKLGPTSVNRWISRMLVGFFNLLFFEWVCLYIALLPSTRRILVTVGVLIGVTIDFAQKRRSKRECISILSGLRFMNPDLGNTSFIVQTNKLRGFLLP